MTLEVDQLSAEGDEYERAYFVLVAEPAQTDTIVDLAGPDRELKPRAVRTPRRKLTPTPHSDDALLDEMMLVTAERLLKTGTVNDLRLAYTMQMTVYCRHFGIEFRNVDSWLESWFERRSAIMVRKAGGRQRNVYKSRIEEESKESTIVGFELPNIGLR